MGGAKLRAARAFQHVLRQFANFSSAARAAAFFAAKSSRVQPVAVLLGQRKRGCAAHARAFVEPALKVLRSMSAGVVGEDQLAGDVVVVGQQI